MKKLLKDIAPFIPIVLAAIIAMIVIISSTQLLWIAVLALAFAAIYSIVYIFILLSKSRNIE